MNRLIYPLILIFLCLLNGVGHCQPTGLVYANGLTPGGTFEVGLFNKALGSFEVTNPNASITNTSFTDFTRLHAANDAATSASVLVQLTFPQVVPANSTIYIKTTLSAMSLLRLGGGVTISYLSGTNTNVSVTDYQTYYTADGNIYFSIKPANTLQSLKITATTAAVLGGEITLDIYYAFYGSNAPNDSDPSSLNVSDCGAPSYTTFSSSGISIGSFGVSNPGRAIDDDALTTMSSFYATGLSLISGKISQTFYFNGLSNLKDAVKIVFSRNSSLVAVNLAKSITLRAYNGTIADVNATAGNPVSVYSIVDLSLLDLQIGTNTAPLTAYYAPKNNAGVSQIFDRIVVEVDMGLLGVALGSNGLNIADIRRVPDNPTVFDAVACTNIGKITLNASFAGQESLTSFTYKWYNAVRDGSLLPTIIGKTPEVTGLTSVGQTNYYVDITKSGCTVPSARAKVTVNTVNPPVVPPIALVP